ncbi:hypothetical protein FRC02_001857 [Tulasnella sp. 418]|nr:hypothetical protein FRC02_001857 [Tulasnella sp. 418]
MAPPSSKTSATRKRKSDTVPSDSVAKRQKKPDRDDLVAKAQRLLEHLNLIADTPGLSQKDRHFAHFKILHAQSVLSEEYSNTVLYGLQVPLQLSDDSLDSSLNAVERGEVKYVFDRANELRQEVVLLYAPLLQYYNSPPPPSGYAVRTVWPIWQEKNAAIKCLRPTHQQGLPLQILHGVFRQFRLQANGELPATAEAAAAIESASLLCSEMGNSFPDEKARQQRFDECIDSLIGSKKWQRQYTINSKNESRTAIVDRCLIMNDVLCIIREDKVEIGEGNDVYMQVSRDFQMYISYLRGESSPLLDHGAPTFLVCVFGPLILIAGGFWDGKSVIVEPLGPAFVMFPDHSRDRIQVLARQLYALKQAANTLSSRQSSATTAPLIPGLPRVYPSFKQFNSEEADEEQSLTFIRPLHEDSPLIFLATAGDSETPRLVKLVNNRYGTITHKKLETEGLAPALYGQKSLVGAPTAYVMEYLIPPSDSPKSGGWVTLYTFAQTPGAVTHKGIIWKALDNILSVMEKEDVVHGDLRANNLMLEVDADGQLSSDEDLPVRMKLVDFDWGGRSGEVTYPLERNKEIAWPAGIGERIVVAHDRQLVRTWFDKLFAPKK